jgi:acetyl esterase/lipase
VTARARRAAALLLFFCAGAAAGAPIRTPTRADAAYGPDPRHRFDFWKADAPGPTPVVVHFPGGAFRRGDKNAITPQQVEAFLARGISVASANYRLTTTSPYPAPMRDGARMVQFLRREAAAFGIDPESIGVYGQSAGGGIALWVACRDDLADPADPDPVLRRSSRVAAAAGFDAQTSYDPYVIAELLTPETARSAAVTALFALPPAERETEAARRLYADASPAHHLTADDPPLYLFYKETSFPVQPHELPGAAIHRPEFGWYLKEKADPLGVEVTVQVAAAGDRTPARTLAIGLADFFERTLRRR